MAGHIQKARLVVLKLIGSIRTPYCSLIREIRREGIDYGSNGRRATWLNPKSPLDAWHAYCGETGIDAPVFDG
jgi:hypothetical protein